MPTPSDLIWSAVVLTVVVGCFTFSWRNALWFFGSIGMFLLWYAWVVYLDIDKNWPADQPRMENYTPSKQEVNRLRDILGENYTDQDLNDYHRCYKYNVCVRKFKK